MATRKKQENTFITAVIELVKEADVEKRRYIASLPDIPVELLVSLADDEDEEVRKALKSSISNVSSTNATMLADCETTSPLILDGLANNDSYFVRRDVAYNSNTSEETLLKLASDKNLKVVQTVLRNPKATKRVFEKASFRVFNFMPNEYIENNLTFLVQLLVELSRLTHSQTNWLPKNLVVSPNCMASYKNTPKEILTELSKHEEWGVRCRVAGHSNTPVEVLVILAKDSVATVRNRVAKNKNTPLEVLKELSKDEKEFVRNDAIKTLDALAM